MEQSDFLVRRETEAARELLRVLAADELGDDAALVADMIEGETGLLEAIDLALADMDEAEALIAGLKEKEGQYQKRRRGLESRVERIRGLIEQAMAVTEQTSLRRAVATLTLKRLPPQVVVVAEPDIPSDYFTAQPPPAPKLDLKRLRDALLDRARQVEAAMAQRDPAARDAALAALPAIPGAVLGAGGRSLQIRRM